MATCTRWSRPTPASEHRGDEVIVFRHRGHHVVQILRGRAQGRLGERGPAESGHHGGSELNGIQSLATHITDDHAGGVQRRPQRDPGELRAPAAPADPEAGSGRLVDTGASEPPLGLAPAPHLVTFVLPAHARLLSYTDGLIETRNRTGDFLPLDRRMVAPLRTGSPGDALDTVLDLLDDPAAQDINDDMALLVVERADDA